MANRVCIGNRGAGLFGLFVTLPGYDVLAEDPDNRERFAFSTTWGDTFRILASGTCNLNVAVSLPPGIGFVPVVLFRPVNTGSSTHYPYSLNYYFTQSSNTAFIYTLKQYYADMLTAGTFTIRVRNAGIPHSSGPFRYIVTNLKVA